MAFVSRFGILVCLAASAGASVRELPFFFEANQGQHNPRVQYSAGAGKYHVFMTQQGPVLSFAGRELGLEMAGGNRAAALQPLDRLRSSANYYVGNRSHWRSGIAQYGRVRYRDVYPGIDVVYYGAQGKLEYDFVLAPGADPRAIRMKFRGADRITATAGGDLIIETAGVQMIQRKPLVYQHDGREIRTSYRVTACDEAVFDVASYDRSQRLTIDPLLEYSSLLGGTGEDAVTGIAVDSAGYVWVVGYTGTGELTSTDLAWQANTAGKKDIFIARLDPKNSGPGSLVYFTYLGGAGDDVPNAMVMDSKDVLYVGGTTDSNDFPLYGNSAENTSSGNTDGFVFKLSLRDGLIYSTYLGGSDYDEINAVAFDSTGAIYAAGMTKSDNFPTTGSAYQGAKWGPQDAVVVKISPSGALEYGSYLGGELHDTGRAIAVDAGGAVYLAGSTVSEQFPTAGNPYSSQPIGGQDVFLARFDVSKSGDNSLTYSAYFGGTLLEDVRKMLVDANGKLWMAGYTLSPDFPVTPGCPQGGLAGNADVFVTQFDFTKPPQSGFVAWSTFLGGVSGDVARDMAMDAQGNLYLAGYTLSADFPVTEDALQPEPGGGVSAFFARIMPNVPGPSALNYSTQFGRAGTHVANGVAVGADGTVAVGGVSGNGQAHIPPGALQPEFGGGVSDAFIAVMK